MRRIAISPHAEESGSNEAGLQKLWPAAIEQSKMYVGVNIHVDDQPIWGPTGCSHVEYLYLPDIDVYYKRPWRAQLTRRGCIGFRSA
jgi:hypothetical protein